MAKAQPEPALAGVLFDLDGVIYVDQALLPGAKETLQALERAQIPWLFITNTSTHTPEDVVARLRAMGMAASREQIFSAVSATERWLIDAGIERIAPLLAEPLVEYFGRRFTIDRLTPEAVVIGDIGERWNFALMNQAFGWLMAGAQLVCIHRNRFWHTAGGLKLDIGAFVSGLEYAAGVDAVVAGKPSALFFASACGSLGLSADRVLVVGDDIDSDIGGAQASGCRAALVRTGKYREALVAQSGITPDWTIPSVAEVPDLLQLT